MKERRLRSLFMIMCLLSYSGINGQTYTAGDITITATPAMYHDSTWCRSFCTNTYVITIINSFVGDSVHVVDLSSASLAYQNGNTTGVTPWTMNVTMPLYNGILDDDGLTGGIATFLGPNLKIISGPDTIHSMPNNQNLAVPNPCTYGSVSGMTYIDNNGDCIYNSGDVPVSVSVSSDANLISPSMTVQLIAASSNSSGLFNLSILESWMANYTVYVPSYFLFIFPPSSCLSGAHTFTTVPQINVDFPLQCSGNVDAQCYAGSPAFVRPNMPFYMQPAVSNIGCDSVSGQLTFIKDSRVNYNASLSTVPATTVHGDTLIWNYTNLTSLTNLGYWNSFLSSIHLTPNSTVHIGDTLCFRVYTNIPAGDINIANNDYTTCLPVVNSYDPNLKEVSPKGTGAPGNIPATTTKLTYTIHFQNTGTAPAYEVNLIDTLDGGITPGSLKVLGTSHTMFPEWIAPGVVKFRFSGIYLPDSNSNEAASHGYVSFTVNLNPGLPIGTQIKNKGYIYFDTNPAIITNTTLNTIASPAQADLTTKNEEIKIYPSPASDHIFVENLPGGTISIINMNGTVVITMEIINNKTMVDINKLPNGIYIVKATNNNNTIARKFTKQ